MSMRPRIAVALASWNGAAFIEAQLQSLATQSRPPDELVVSDDASTDVTADLVERVCQREGLPLRLLKSPARGGVVANFERAIAAADADIIVLSDQDDVWRGDKLAVIERAFVDRPDVGGVFSDGRLIDATGRPSGRTLWDTFGYRRGEQRRAGRGAITEVLLRRNLVTGATLAFRGNCRDLLLPLARTGWHDAWIALLVSVTTGLIGIPEALVDYRIHDRNAAGLGVRDARQAIAQRAGDGQHRELEYFEGMLERLRGWAPNETHNIALLEQKVRFLRLRCDLPHNTVGRALRISRALPAYARYSSGWRSPVLDLVAPARDAR